MDTLSSAMNGVKRIVKLQKLMEKYNCSKCNEPYKGELKKGSICKKCGYNGFTSPSLKRAERIFNEILSSNLK